MKKSTMYAIASFVVLVSVSMLLALHNPQLFGLKEVSDALKTTGVIAIGIPIGAIALRANWA